MLEQHLATFSHKGRREYDAKLDPDLRRGDGDGSTAKNAFEKRHHRA
jgi:hypothetical protein